MKNKYEFFIAGRARNKESILQICDLFDKYNISYYCFLKNEDDWGYGNKNQTPEEIDNQLKDIQIESLSARRGGRGQPDPCRADAHEGVQNGPYHRKYPVRRRQGRFGYGGAEVGHAAPGQPAGEDTHGLGE